jgi:Uma2 family endonuclease
VVEILSPSTALRDGHTKYQYYQQQGIPYYLIIETEKKLIELYKLVEGVYQLQEEDGVHQFDLNSECSIIPKLHSVFD